MTRDVLETCQEAFRFVRMQLTNFQELVAGQIFEDLVQEFKVPQSLRNQFEEKLGHLYCAGFGSKELEFVSIIVFKLVSCYAKS